jgi:glycosyltransferase involved in cell wall biosynthesis
MKVLSYVKDLDGSSYHRVFTPNNLIDADVRTVKELKEEDLAWCDILHYSRFCPQDLKSLRSKYGFKIVVDTDDWWEVGKDHPKYEFWSKASISYHIQSHLMNADAVICTHERLAEVVRPINPNVFIIPNMINYGKGQFRYRKQKSDKIRLLYASTIMNYSNTSIIAGAMKKLSDLPIEVVIAGHHDNPLFDILVKNLTDGKIPHSFTPWSGVEKYMSCYQGDIGIIPSKDTKFNSLKSNLKVLEYAALKMPVVCSKADPYLGMPVNYFTGENSFVDHIRDFVENPKSLKMSGDFLHDFCKKNYSYRPEERLDVYKKILNGL